MPHQSGPKHCRLMRFIKHELITHSAVKGVGDVFVQLFKLINESVCKDVGKDLVEGVPPRLLLKAVLLAHYSRFAFLLESK